MPSSRRQRTSRPADGQSRAAGPIASVANRRTSDASAKARFQACIQCQPGRLNQNRTTVTAVNTPTVACRDDPEPDGSSAAITGAGRRSARAGTPVRTFRRAAFLGT
jgi:hypothetical protein